MYTLVVVDMQPRFVTTSAPMLVKACQREIIMAKRRKAAIIYLEFEGFGNTLGELTYFTHGYDKAYFATKNADDGSRQVIDLITKHNLYHNVRVIGVNTSYCVLSTIRGLMDYHGKITVVADACNCYNHDFGLKRLADMNIKIIRGGPNIKKKIDRSLAL